MGVVCQGAVPVSKVISPIFAASLDKVAQRDCAVLLCWRSESQNEKKSTVKSM